MKNKLPKKKGKKTGSAYLDSYFLLSFISTFCFQSYLFGAKGVNLNNVFSLLMFSVHQY